MHHSDPMQKFVISNALSVRFSLTYLVLPEGNGNIQENMNENSEFRITKDSMQRHKVRATPVCKSKLNFKYVIILLKYYTQGLGTFMPP